MHFVTLHVIRGLRAHPERSLLKALEASHAFKLASARFLLAALEEVIPADAWHDTRGEDAVAALELVDP